MAVLGNEHSARTPSGLKVAPMSYAKIEAAADQLRPLLPLAKEGAATGFKLDAWRILEQTLPQGGFDYRVAEVGDMHNCAAFTIPDRKLVVIRSDVYDGLFSGSVFSASTVVHELSHIVLGHAVTLHRGAPAGQHEFYEDSEWQAKAMTAALMMPIAACRMARTSEKLARLCGVSMQAATYRLKRLMRERIV